MKIFITGGAGFIGSHLIPKLVVRKHKLLLLTRSHFRKKASGNKSIAFLYGDLRDIAVWKNKLRKFKPDAVIHLAWEDLESYDFKAITSSINLINSLNLISAAAELKCKKFLSIGSCWEYGKAEGRLKESDSLLPPSHVPDFVFAKRAIQALGEQIALQAGMQFLWIRLFFSYGPGQKPRAIIPHLALSLQKGILPEIKNKSGANDFVYIDDVAEALVRILEKSKKPSAIYNIGSGHLTNVASIVEEVYRGFNIPIPRWSLVGSKARPRGFYASISKIKKEIGWKPKTNIVEGVKKTIAYYQKL